MKKRFEGCLLGLACGDALGASVEFQPPGSFIPLTDMVGGGPFNLKPGQWTDDTAMALCLAESLVSCRGFNARDQMERYCRWRDEGLWSSTGVCFDIGYTTAAALRRFEQSGDPYAGSTDPLTSGNGSLMRLAPIPMFYVEDLRKAAFYAAESSRTTHASREAVDACRLFAVMVALALRGEPKHVLLFETYECYFEDADLAPAIAELARGSYRRKKEADLVASGYVVNTLEAALWSFWQAENFRQAVLLAANLGHDADTTAAVCGQLAGAFYGVEKIPRHWLNCLARAEEIRRLAAQLYELRWRPS
ncbi:MAG: ADP-ribosylglycohydrolase family protein [Anaerolineales bacterium]|nr:ADP-ribosylglycohydrolase family protein [Anaerolineales bacterium]MCS7247854.1 ADP-ribosylglycohydrolase family protein [Anaerolineales bacterium]MDW8161664.1 ADP-ribosylglycohydrolase family protein [Anaerolineales bacterium]MDW8446978.1 ADP-ribosylglycohydrolase family protein [Anaerolineales bacterium]